jgi:hypothetical protein
MKNKKVYIVLFQYQLSKHYSTKDVNATERCEFVDRLTNRHITDSVFILNFTDQTVKKSRNLDLTYESLFGYIESKFPEQIEQLKQYVNSGVVVNEVVAQETQEAVTN